MIRVHIIDTDENPTFNNTIEHNGFTYKTLTASDGRVWLDRNIGAVQACESDTDEYCYGDYFQFARNSDGHEKKDSLVTDVKATSINNAGDKLIDGQHWLAANADLNASDVGWARIDGGSVCPVGFNVPNGDDFPAGSPSFHDTLNIPKAGSRGSSGRFYNDNNLTSYGVTSILWTRNTNAGLPLGYFGTSLITSGPSDAIPIRCVKAIDHTW